MCGTLTPKQYIGLAIYLLTENGLQMAITLLLKGGRTSPFGTLIQGPLSQSSTLMEGSHLRRDGAFLWMDNTLALQLLQVELDYGT